jgi:predicted unusual protein kinase regulating ubiquinone biosynthesis (AarF/ABC1/UbiB family)
MITSPRKRRRKAYASSFKIGWSYTRLYLLKKIFGQSFYNKRIQKLHNKNANRAKQVILELNGLFIKVGQLLSIMSNVVPKAYGTILESLQDNTPSTGFDETKKTIELQLGDKLENLFSFFDENTLASASIGQVHRATLRSGENVAVKIQHPNIDMLAKVDLSIIENLNKLVGRIFKIKGLDHAYNQVKQMIYEELDYNQEAQSIIKIKSNCAGIKNIVIPEVFLTHSNHKVLTTSFCEGVKITNLEQISEWNIDSNQIAKSLVYVYCEMILNHGLYHADPHPGNLLVNKKGEIVILDFGAIGKLSDEMKENIPFFIRGVITKDQEKVLEALKKMGFIAQGKEAEKTAQTLIKALAEFFESGINIREFNFDDIKDSNIADLRKNISIKELTSTIQVPKDWILLERTIMLLDGVTAKIAPEYKPLDTIKPYLRRLVLKNGGLRKIIFDVVKKQVTTLFSLPKKISSFLTKAENGEIEIELKNLDKKTKKLYSASQQFVFGLLILAGLIMSFVSSIYQQPFYEKLFIILSSTFGVLMLNSLIRNRK